jgi:hypothetical protein
VVRIHVQMCDIYKGSGACRYGRLGTGHIGYKMRHFYFGIENIGLNGAQKWFLFNELMKLGPVSDESPARLNHWRVRSDTEAIIYEALFTEDNLSIDAIKTKLASFFGISPVTIGHTISSQSYSGGTTTLVVFRRTGTDYLRMALFGGPGATWEQSGDECRGYLAATIDEWEDSVE